MEAATASIAGGLFAYVASLNVAKRERNAGIDEGRYSAVGGSAGAGVDEPGKLKGSAFRVRVAARLRMAVRWGVLFPVGGTEGVEVPLWMH